MSRVFLGLLTPPEIKDKAKQNKQAVGERSASRGAQNSPPHITLQPPFEWVDAKLPLLEECLRDFASGRESVSLTLSGYGAFAKRVIYINVVRSPELLAMHADLMAYLENKLLIVDKVSKTRPFAPHMTVAFKDLTQQNFKAAWSEFEKRELQFEFTASHLTLLLHDGKQWNVKSEFAFLSSF